MPRIVVLVAGLPRGILGPLITRLKRGNENLDVLETLPLGSGVYTAEYAEELYRLVGSRLREVVVVDRGGWWDLNFVVLYVRKQDGSDRHLMARFGMEALLVPLTTETTRRKAPKRHTTNAAINAFVSQSTRMLRNARAILRSLAQEVTNRDTRTCVLLPRANLGIEFEKVKDCVQGAVANRDPAETFDAQLRAVADRLPKGSHGHFRSGRLVFRAPSKAGARHGLAPL